MQIRTRLTLEFTAIFAVLLLIFSLTIYYFTSFYRKNDFYGRLQHRAEITARMFLERDRVSESAQQQNLKEYFQVLPGEIVQIYDRSNNIVFHDGDGRLEVQDGFLKTVRQRGQDRYERDNRQVVGISRTGNGENFVIMASTVDYYSLGKLSYLKVLLILGNLASLVVVLVAGWFFAKQAMRPVQKIITEVEKINASDLHLRLSDAGGKDELSHLASTFNNMLNRLESAFEMQNTFVSNASHELRTPLTAMIGEMEVALMKHRDSEEYERVLHSILEDARRLAALSNGLLQIASASFDISKVKLSPVRVDEILWMAAAEVKKRRPGTKIEVEFLVQPEDEERLIIKGNEPLLLIALLNVLENAEKFSPDGDAVQASIQVIGQDVVLTVSDKGRGIEPSDLKHVFVPFFRADNVRDISGHGIGLPLAEKILRLHKGSIQIRSTIGKGTEVKIALPSHVLFITI
jgi:signal transduction histidine kinase